MAVNLSPIQFEQANFTDRIKNLVLLTGIQPSNVELELTESVFMEDIQRIQQILTEMRDAGFGVALDDFGTGYSSLSYLKDLPISTLKIDRSFIIDIAKEKRDASIVEATIAMAHILGLNVIAEGIENEAQYNLIAAYECDEIQGYIFSRPLPADEFVKWLSMRERQVSDRVECIV